jgi:PAS domain S-box-containing protein
MNRKLSEMASLDISLSTLNKVNDENIEPSKGNVMPLLSWDIFRQYDYLMQDKLQLEKDIDFVKAYANKAKWKNELNVIFENKDFEALVITDLNEKIVWVNNGFTKMTGYTEKEALDKTPVFLQGKNTSVTKRKSIRKKLDKLEPFTEIITNYRKDNSPYECEVKIFPLYTNEVTHFIALEKEVV